MLKRLLILILLIALGTSCTSKRSMTKAPVPPPPPPPPVATADTRDSEGDGVPDFVDEESSTGRPKVIVSSSNILILERTEKVEMRPKLRHVGKKQTSATDTKRAEGRILYSIPDSMTVGKTFEVFARISHSRDTVTITENVTGEVRTSVIPVSEVMEVELVDPGPEGDKNFSITKNNDGRQMIEEGETYTEWRWDVTPVKSGNKTLKIVVSVIRGSERKQTVYVDEVVVNANIKHETKNFFEKYWQWLTTTIVIPFIVWLYKRRKKEKEE